MGTTYKLKPEIINLIIERKKNNPALSCRHFTLTFKKEFNLKLSKSSINAIFKEAGLSLPAGRRDSEKKKKTTPKLKIPQISIKPKVLAEIADKPKIKLPAPTTPTEPIIVSQQKTPTLPAHEIDLSGEKTSEVLLRAINYLIDSNPTEYKDFSDDAILSEGLRTAIAKVSRACRSIKLLLSDETTIFLDGLNYTIWNTSLIPSDFSTPVAEITRRLNLDSDKDILWVFFMAPESAMSDEFIALTCASKKNAIEKITLYGNSQEELVSLKPPADKQIDIIFALWPWQLKECRLIKHIADFLPYRFDPTGIDYFAAEAEVELKNKKAKGGQVFYGYALKSSMDGKTETIILTTFDKNRITAQKVLDTYLGRWPNLKTTAHDFDQKLEYFSFTSQAQQLFSLADLDLSAADDSEKQGTYLIVLDAYLRFFIFPRAYRSVNLSTMRERFYTIKVECVQKNNYHLIKFKPSPDFAYLDDLTYACQRLNERLIITPDNKKIWFSI